MTIKEAKLNRPMSTESDYAAFQQLDGRHPWQDKVPEGLILYPTRRLTSGTVAYFNFDLAKEMGLIAPDHPNKLNRKLTQMILETFCLRIVNEYDREHKVRYPRVTLQPHAYMATRYLQMQHSDRTGRTSGDGRCIWNGTVRGPNGSTWDVSSRGTGVTALAPGVVEAGRPLKSGNMDHGYGCGMADIDELLGASISAEVFHRNGIPTERVLAIVDLGKGMGIGVRAAPNLLRPAHMFLFLRQGKREPLERAFDYFIQRQFDNGRWDIRSTDPLRYQKALDRLAQDYARFAAYLERDYIFAWLDWDGDNVLADAGIIDYGSVRQFGLRHDQYRYDDVTRFSTNLNEQRLKARDTVQTFAQMVHFLQTGRMEKWRKFSRHKSVKSFDRVFKDECLQRFLYQIGLVGPLQRLLLNQHRRAVQSLYSAHCHLERIKTFRKARKVADGIHRPAILNMRRALALMPTHLLKHMVKGGSAASPDEVFSWIISSQATKRERQLRGGVRKKIQTWQQAYLNLFKKISTPANGQKILAGIELRAQTINCDERMTGNALINVVDEILQRRRKGLSNTELQFAIDRLIAAQTLNPDFQSNPPGPVATPGKASAKTTAPRANSLVRGLLTVVHGFREDI